MPTALTNKFVAIEGINYNFDYVLVPRTRPGKTETDYSFFAAVPGYDYKRARPKEWIFIKMTTDEYVVYSPTQPFILLADPVADFVTFVDFTPADKRDKYKTIRILMEASPGIWPAEPTPGQTMIATKIDVDAVTRMLDDEEEAKKQAAVEKKDAINPAEMDEKIQKTVESTLEKLLTKKVDAKEQPDKKTAQPDKSKAQTDKIKAKDPKPKSEDQIRKELSAKFEKEYEEKERRIRREEEDRYKRLAASHRQNRSPRRQDDRRPRSPSKSKTPEKKKKDEVMEAIQQGFDKLASSSSKPVEPVETVQQQIVRAQQEQLALLQQQQHQIRLQQQQLQQMKPHRAFGLPSQDLANLLPYPDNRYPRGPLTKRHSLDRSLEHSMDSTEVTPERTRKLPVQHYQWMQSRYPPEDHPYDAVYKDY